MRFIQTTMLKRQPEEPSKEPSPQTGKNSFGPFHTTAFDAVGHQATTVEEVGGLTQDIRRADEKRFCLFPVWIPRCFEAS